MTQFVQLSPDTTKVITWYGVSQLPPDVSDKPGYAEIDDTDSRYIAYLNLKSGNASYTQAIAAGVNITSTGTPSLNGTYALDLNTRSNVTAEQVYIATNSTFTNGGTTRAWPDAVGAFHTFPSTTEFTAFATAVAKYYDALATAYAVVQGGGFWSAPSMPAALP